MIHLSHHIQRFLTTRSRKVQLCSMSTRTTLLQIEAKGSGPFPPEIIPTNILQVKCVKKNCHFAMGSDVVNLKKWYCCCCAYSGDNLRSSHDSRNDTWHATYRDRSVQCRVWGGLWLRLLALALGIVSWHCCVCLKAHTSAASNRPP